MDLLSDIGGIVTAVSLIIFALTIFVPFGAILPFLLSLRSIRIKRRDGSLCLAGLDPAPMVWAGFFLCAVCGFSATWGWEAVLPTVGASLVLWFGFRLRVRVSAERTRVVRSFAYVIPWSWRGYDEAPTVFVDGWGDFMDPEALHLGFEEEGTSIELAWGDKSTAGRCEELAAEFNEVVRELMR